MTEEADQLELCHWESEQARDQFADSQTELGTLQSAYNKLRCSSQCAA